MSKFLSLCNELVSVQSTCKEPLPVGGEYHDKFMQTCGILHTRNNPLTEAEMDYGWAVVGNGFKFEVRLKKFAMNKLSSLQISKDDKKHRAAMLAKLGVNYAKTGNRYATAKDFSQYLGLKSWSWYKRYKYIYDEIVDMCHELESSANQKIWLILNDEMKNHT